MRRIVEIGILISNLRQNANSTELIVIFSYLQLERA